MIASVSGEEHSFIETGQPQSSDLACRHELKTLLWGCPVSIKLCSSPLTEAIISLFYCHLFSTRILLPVYWQDFQYMDVMKSTTDT